jgi:hypothetical protein
MPSTNPRVNTVLEPHLYAAIKGLAEHEGVSMSQKVRDLVKEALETYEDAGWESLVLARQEREGKWHSLDEAEDQLTLG